MLLIAFFVLWRKMYAWASWAAQLRQQSCPSSAASRAQWEGLAHHRASLQRRQKKNNCRCFGNVTYRVLELRNSLKNFKSF